MAENIKELIEKIQSEGVDVALGKAKKIEDAAIAGKEEIIAQAKLEAENLLTQAKNQIAKLEETSILSLEQSSRDAILSLKKEISSLLEKVITAQVREVLTPDELSKIIYSLIEEQVKNNPGEIAVSFNKNDLEKFKNTAIHKLKDGILKGVSLKSRDDIAAGFTISYDGAKSHFDFTDKALAEYLAQYVKPKLAEIIKNSIV